MCRRRLLLPLCVCVLAGAFAAGVAIACDDKGASESMGACASPGDNEYSCNQEKESVCTGTAFLHYTWEEDFPTDCVDSPGNNCDQPLRKCKQSVKCEWKNNKCQVKSGSGGAISDEKKRESDPCDT